MNTQDSLRTLAAMQAPAAPFGFEQFEQRHALATVRRRTTVLSAAGSMATLGVVAVMALVTQSPPQDPVVAQPALMAPEPEAAELPALVNLDQFDLTTELEDHIALLDAELSAARVQAASAQRLRQMESAREQLSQSLQRVSYAHSLLNL